MGRIATIAIGKFLSIAQKFDGEKLSGRMNHSQNFDELLVGFKGEALAI